MNFGWLMFLAFWASIIIGAIIPSGTGIVVAVLGVTTAIVLWIFWFTFVARVEAPQSVVDEAIAKRKSGRVSLPAQRENPRTIPSAVKREVWARDGGRCVLCGASEELHFDHEIPFSKGGASTTANVRILCARHNLRKGAKIE